jgi:hypothetical protein
MVFLLGQILNDDHGGIIDTGRMLAFTVHRQVGITNGR